VSDPQSLSLAELEVDVGTSIALSRLPVETVGDLLALSPEVLPARAAREVQRALSELGLRWGQPVAVPPYLPPEERRRPRLTVAYQDGAGRVDRTGGAPTAWGGTPAWPACASCKKPMAFVLQLLGPPAGGVVDLAGAAALQVFLCQGERCEKPWAPLSGANAALLRPRLCDGDAPLACPALPCARIVLSPGYDDALLEREDAQDADEETYWEAFAYGQADKIGGIATTGNPPHTPACPSCGETMAYLAQLGDERVAKPFDDGVVVLHLCRHGHAAAYQAVR
jgi:hypothetical protein